MSSNVRLVVREPLTRDGEELPASELNLVRIESRVQGAPDFAEVASLTESPFERLFENLPGGTWHFRAIVVDTDGRESPPGEASIDLPLGDPDEPTITLTIE